MLISARCGIPMLPFVARPSTRAANSLVGDQSLIDSIFEQLDTESAGRSLLRAEGLSFEHPHFSAATTTCGRRARRRLTVSLCGDARGAGPQHRIALTGYDQEGREALEEIGLSIRPAYKGSAGWRHESSFASFG